MSDQLLKEIYQWMPGSVAVLFIEKLENEIAESNKLAASIAVEIDRNLIKAGA